MPGDEAIPMLGLNNDDATEHNRESDGLLRSSLKTERGSWRRLAASFFLFGLINNGKKAFEQT